MMSVISKHLLNLRPYSWADLLLLGLAAKSFAGPVFPWSKTDLFIGMALLFLWFFYNLALEAKHAYAERGTPAAAASVIFLIAGAAIGAWLSPESFLPAALSAMLVWLYLQKARHPFFGLTNYLPRGLIEACYFLFALLCYGGTLTVNAGFMTIIVTILYATRGLIGDLRDLKHNAKAGKMTLAVRLGERKTAMISFVLLIAAAAFSAWLLGSIAFTVPLLVFAACLAFYGNGYVLHQLAILTTSAFLANIIMLSAPQTLMLLNLIFAGISLNHIFYPLLARKSNPSFVQDNFLGWRF